MRKIVTIGVVFHVVRVQHYVLHNAQIYVKVIAVVHVRAVVESNVIWVVGKTALKLA